MSTDIRLFVDREKIGLTGRLADRLGVSDLSLPVARTRSTALRVFDAQRNELDDDQIEASDSLYTAAITVGRHDNALYCDREHDLVVPNLQIRCEHIRGTPAELNIPPLAVPTRFFTADSATTNVAQHNGFWTPTTRVLVVAAAGLINGMLGGVVLGTLTGVGTFAGASLCSHGLSWAAIRSLSAKWTLRGAAAGACVGAGVGGRLQWRVCSIEGTRAKLLDDVGKQSKKMMQQGVDAPDVKEAIGDIFQEFESFRKQAGAEESVPLMVALKELIDLQRNSEGGRNV